jgi:hypothetical protein
VFTARYGLSPYIKTDSFRRSRVKVVFKLTSPFYAVVAHLSVEGLRRSHMSSDFTKIICTYYFIRLQRLESAICLGENVRRRTCYKYAWTWV